MITGGKRLQYFPAISIQQQGKTSRGFSALRLASILQGELLIDPSAAKDSKIAAFNKMNPVMLQKTRESFIQALGRLDTSVTLELSITTFPKLGDPAGNQVEIAIFICCEDRSETLVKEKLVSTFLNLKPLLAAYFPEADYQMVTDARAIQKMRDSKAFTHVTRISRQYETIALGTLSGRKPIGFGADAEKDRQPSESIEIRHKALWIPSYDDWFHLIHVMLNQIGPARVLIRLRNAASCRRAMEKLETTVLACDRFVSSAADDNITLKEQAVLIKKQALYRIGKMTEAGFKIGVFLFTETHTNDFLATILGNTITETPDQHAAGFCLAGGFHLSDIAIETAVDLHCFSDDPDLYTVTEAACAFRLPSPPLEDIPAGFPVKKFRTAPAMLHTGTACKESITIGLNCHNGIELPVPVDNESRFRHCFILGQTGTGKSTLMAHMIMQDIRAGRGVAVVDPHGEMIDQIVGQIPEDRAEDVIFFDPLDTERPIGFNVLEWNTVYERDLIIDELYRTFHHLYDFKQTGGPIFELYFRGALGMLMGDKKREDFTATLLDFTRFFTDKQFRNYLKDSVDDLQLHDFLKQAEAVCGDASMQNVTPYIISKFARFRDITLTRIIGQTSTKFSFEGIMDQGKIFLIKLGKGRFGSTTSALLANMIVGRFKLAAMKRSEMPASLRRDFFLYVDEAHNLPSDNSMELLSEARKYKLGLVLATQYAAQLTRTTPETRDNLLSAILGNVGQTIIFRLGPEDAQAMAPSLYPCFGKQDIIGLPNWHGYVRMQQNNNNTAPFSIKTLIDDTPWAPETAQRIKHLSRIKYGMNAPEIDKMICDRRSVLPF
jgi:hypothetical protein